MMAQARRLVWRSWEPIAAHAARSYIAGPTFRDAARACNSLAREGFSATVCPWNAAGDSWRDVADAYLDAIRGLAQDSSLNCYLSIKAPAIGFSRDLLDEVLEKARPRARLIHFDSLAPEDAARTWELIEHAVERHRHVGCTLPARWRRSWGDVERAVELGIRVRIVRGQWADPDFPDGRSADSFIALVEKLAGRARHIAVATHDPKLAHDALHRVQEAATPCELELLYGLASRQPVRVARTLGVPQRMYVPYGQAWLPYCLSEARKHPRILWWIMRDSVLSWTRPAPAAPLIAGRLGDRQEPTE